MPAQPQLRQPRPRHVQANQRVREAAAEALYRRKVRSSLAAWARHCGFEPAPHHQLIIAEIERFLASDEDVLLLHAPPGSAKSTYLSILLPSWYLASHPTHNVIAATHSLDFAQRWGRRVRNLVRTESAVLGIDLDDGVAAVTRWATKAGGEYYGVGAGVGISGFRADLAIGDDLFGTREDAWSEAVRKTRWDWYRDDFGNRIRPGAKRILMNTRWHWEDVAGHVLEQLEKGEVTGRVIDIKAVAEDDDPLGRPPGAYLWDDPSGYNYGEFLRRRQRELDPMMWAALFQQRPAPVEGAFFLANWMKPYTGAPPPRDRLKIFGASDYAMTAGAGDYTVHLVVGLDEDEQLWLLDLWRDRTEPAKWVEAFCDMVIDWRPLGWAEEHIQITAGIGPYLESRQRLRKAWVAREQFPTRGDKAFRAQGIRGRMALGGILIPVDKPWCADFKSELLGFPAGKHDDCVDAMGLVGQLLDLMFPPMKPEAPPPPKRQLDWFEEPSDPHANNWKVL